MFCRFVTQYRYGFNGKENDSETSTQDYGMRIYNPALGKFLSVDPLTTQYPWNSTYAFAENDVIRSIDLDGGEKKFTYNSPVYTTYKGSMGKYNRWRARDRNTPVNTISTSFTSLYYHQTGGTSNWIEQNDNGYIYPWFPNFDRFAPDESSGIWELTYAIFSNKLTKNVALNFHTGFMGSRIKGGSQENGVQIEHWGHGTTTIGPEGRIDLSVNIRRGMSLNLTTRGSYGISISDYGPNFSEGKLNVSGLDKTYPNWSTHGSAGTIAFGLNFSFGENVFSKHASNLFHLSVGTMMSTLLMSKSSYENKTTGRIYSKSWMSFQSSPGFNMSLSYDIGRGRKKK